MILSFSLPAGLIGEQLRAELEAVGIHGAGVSVSSDGHLLVAGENLERATAVSVIAAHVPDPTRLASLVPMGPSLDDLITTKVNDALEAQGLSASAHSIGP